MKPPPAAFRVIGTSVEQSLTEGDKAYTKTSTELKVPEGYAARSAVVAWGGHYAAPPRMMGVVVGDQYLRLHSKRTSAFLNGETDTVPLGIVSHRIRAAMVNVEVECQLLKGTYQAWQIQTFNSIVTAYERLKARYDEQIAAADVEAGVAIAGRNPLANRHIEHTELKRAALEVLTAQQFGLFNAMRSAPQHGYPEQDLSETAAEGPYVQFFEQAFEWKNLTYVFYPYFWGRKEDWVNVSQLDDADPLFGQFLRAGAARVQVPVRPGFEDALLYFLESGGDIWNGGDPPHIEDELYVSLIQEIRDQTGADFIDGPGTVAVTNNSANVVGDATEFGPQDVDREIRIDGVTYRIRSVESATALTLTKPISGSTASGLPYGLGPRLVGQPWDVRLPTTLVQLQATSSLPAFNV